jgi:hypothetical protein
MFYIILVIHILSASMILLTFIQLFFPKKLFQPHQTFLIVMPLAIFQLFSGFTMISLKQYDFKEIWIQGSTIGFIIFITSWLIFVKFSSSRFRPLSFIMLLLSTLTLLIMIFLMTNKIA